LIGVGVGSVKVVRLHEIAGASGFRHRSCDDRGQIVTGIEAERRQ
jgi:hypothetical protein